MNSPYSFWYSYTCAGSIPGQHEHPWFRDLVSGLMVAPGCSLPARTAIQEHSSSVKNDFKGTTSPCPMSGHNIDINERTYCDSAKSNFHSIRPLGHLHFSRVVAVLDIVNVKERGSHQCARCSNPKSHVLQIPKCSWQSGKDHVRTKCVVRCIRKCCLRNLFAVLVESSDGDVASQRHAGELRVGLQLAAAEME